MSEEVDKTNPREFFSSNPADLTLSNLDQSAQIKQKELILLREQLIEVQKQRFSFKSLKSLKKQVREKHEELMEILRIKERISREITKKQP